MNSRGPRRSPGGHPLITLASRSRVIGGMLCRWPVAGRWIPTISVTASLPGASHDKMAATVDHAAGRTLGTCGATRSPRPVDGQHPHHDAVDLDATSRCGARVQAGINAPLPAPSGWEQSSYRKATRPTRDMVTR